MLGRLLRRLVSRGAKSAPQASTVGDLLGFMKVFEARKAADIAKGIPKIRGVFAGDSALAGIARPGQAARTKSALSRRLTEAEGVSLGRRVQGTLKQSARLTEAEGEILAQQVKQLRGIPPFGRGQAGMLQTIQKRRGGSFSKVLDAKVRYSGLFPMNAPVTPQPGINHGARRASGHGMSGGSHA